MIKTFLYDRSTGEKRKGGEEALTEWESNPDLWIWVDLDNEDQQRESTMLQQTFGVHPLVIADAQRKRHPPKLELFEEYFFLLTNGVKVSDDDVDFKTLQIAFFVSDRFMVTRHADQSGSIDTIWAGVEGADVDVGRGSAHLAYRVLRRVSDRYSELVERLESRLEPLEDEMFENPRDALLEDLMSYGRNLKRLRRIFTYQKSLFARLSGKSHPFIGKEERHEFIDAFEQTERLESLTGLYKELTDDLMNGYISITSHRLNGIMKVLTVVTVIFLPLTLLVGIYGMNFEHIPELKFHNAYFVLLSVMGAIAVGLLLLFRKMRWL